MAEADQKLYSMEEVKKHNKDNDCWIVIHGIVYDVTRFLADHPGGPDTILQHAGDNATEGFEDASHSNSARKDMKKYAIGKLEGADSEDAAASGASAAAKPAAAAKSGSSDHGGSYVAYAIPIVFLLGALFFQFYWKPSQAAAGAQ